MLQSSGPAAGQAEGLSMLLSLSLSLSHVCFFDYLSLSLSLPPQSSCLSLSISCLLFLCFSPCLCLSGSLSTFVLFLSISAPSLSCLSFSSPPLLSFQLCHSFLPLLPISPLHLHLCLPPLLSLCLSCSIALSPPMSHDILLTDLSVFEGTGVN